MQVWFTRLIYSRHSSAHDKTDTDFCGVVGVSTIALSGDMLFAISPQTLSKDSVRECSFRVRWWCHKDTTLDSFESMSHSGQKHEPSNETVVGQWSTQSSSLSHDEIPCQNLKFVVAPISANALCFWSTTIQMKLKQNCMTKGKPKFVINVHHGQSFLALPQMMERSKLRHFFCRGTQTDLSNFEPKLLMTRDAALGLATCQRGPQHETSWTKVATDNPSKRVSLSSAPKSQSVCLS